MPTHDPSTARASFRNPPPGFGEVSFYWWLGDPLTHERLTWHLEQLADMHISGLQINYAHSDTGGRSYGLTYPSDPPLFSDKWWELFGWFLGEVKQHGISLSLSDYTIGVPGQGWYLDDMLGKHPDMRGQVLKPSSKVVSAGPCEWTFEHSPLCVAAFRLVDGQIDAASRMDLTHAVHGGRLSWVAPEGEWQLCSVAPSQVDSSIDPMHPRIGAEVCERFFGQFERRHPREGGKGLNFFFSDELTFNVSGHLWTNDFAAEFARHKGYDLLPELPALFWQTGSRSAKVRLDYWDVLVELEEERYFRPLFDWHEARGMTYGCDHGGRGRNVSEFGDYFRTQRWNQGPGADQPKLGKDLIKAKVAASIAHLYRRPRVWLEGFYSSGWDTTAAQVVDASLANFAMGFNLLTLHGLYYSTHGGFWEWAPPCNHFHMPYWRHTRGFMKCMERLSYLLSQGVHRCDVAVLYPVDAAHADASARQSVATAFGVGEQLYASGIDFDFIDWQSIARSTIARNELLAAGARYRVLILPDMKVLRQSTLEKAREFRRSGGIVVAIGSLPQASDRAGADDPWLDDIVRELFGGSDESAPSRHESGGVGVRVSDLVQAVQYIATAFPRDVQVDAPSGAGSRFFFQHRVIGERHLYFLYGAEAGTRCTLRATGFAELWNPWTGETRPLPILSQTDTHTTLALPLTATEATLIVFSPGEPTFASQIREPLPTHCIPLDGDWHFEVVPSLDNRFGDYEWPPTPTMIEPQVRQLRYRPETDPAQIFAAADLDHSDWPKVTASFGPRFWRLGPLPDGVDLDSLETQLVAIDDPSARRDITVGEHRLAWTPYEFSWRWGLEGDPGPQGYHGLKCRVTDDFIALGERVERKHSSHYQREQSGHHYLLWTTVHAPADTEADLVVGGLAPASIRLRGEVVRAGRVKLNAGANALLLRYDDAGRGHVVLGTPGLADVRELPLGELRMRWCDQPALLQFDPTPAATAPAGWYRFDSPPGLRGFELAVVGTPQVWIGGRPVPLPAPSIGPGGARVYHIDLDAPIAKPTAVAIRIAFERGVYAGAALPQPIRLKCGPGVWTTGDWSANDGLLSYSGGARYRKTFELSKNDVESGVEIDLGTVDSTAEVRINGRPAGILVAPPWRLDITPLVAEGANEVDVLVCSTLSNHYSTIPSRYRGKPHAGLIGPVRVISTRASDHER